MTYKIVEFPLVIDKSVAETPTFPIFRHFTSVAAERDRGFPEAPWSGANRPLSKIYYVTSVSC